MLQVTRHRWIIHVLGALYVWAAFYAATYVGNHVQEGTPVPSDNTALILTFVYPLYWILIILWAPFLLLPGVNILIVLILGVSNPNGPYHLVMVTTAVIVWWAVAAFTSREAREMAQYNSWRK